MFKGLMTGISGIRGIVGEGMTPEVALLWSGGFGTWLKGKKVVVGRDTRPTGEMLMLAVKAGLVAAGCNIDDIGVVTTPVGALAVERRGAAGGIIITASHNPQHWNALKFIRGDGRMLTERDYNELERIVLEGPLRAVGWNSLGKVHKWDNANLMYLNSVLGMGILDLNRIQSKQLKVGIDCVNGAGSAVYPKMLEALGCKVAAIHSDESGMFPHDPEPIPENISDLSELVISEKCNIGFAVDPDGDRLSVVDETGTPIGEELTLALAINAVLEFEPGPVVVNSLTSQVIDDIAEIHGVECHRTKVGEANVAAGMKELNAIIGGEGNGGIIYPELHLVRDAGVGMAIILNKLTSTRKTAKELHEELPSYKMIKESIPLGVHDPRELIESLAGYYEHDQVSRIDGLRVIQQDGWVQVRPSNTEPILRVYAEAKDEHTAREMLSQMLTHLSAISNDSSNE